MAQDIYEYTVTGHVGRHTCFPFDMLRHDHAWPAYEQECYMLAPQERPTVVTVTLRGIQAPTQARWSSFGWKVGRVAVIR